jgi:hypothetical protein
MKQTAVEWLLEMQLKPLSKWPNNIYEQALEMEKQQIINAYSKDRDAAFLIIENVPVYAERYYNEIYKSK